MSRHLIFIRSRQLVALALLIFAAAVSGAGQSSKPSTVSNADQNNKPSAVSGTDQNNKLATDDLAEMYRLHTMLGKLLARGSNQEPTGDLKLLSYILEELDLGRPLQVKIDGRSTEVGRAWRLTITSTHFSVRTMPAFVLLDDRMIGIGVESPDLSKLTVIIFDQRLLREGARIAISYENDYSEREELLEKLKLKSSK